MKKFVCMLLALVLCLSTAALAEDTPSKTVTDLTQFQVTAENQPGDETISLMPVTALTVGENMEDYQERIAICDKEIAKLAASGDPADYFANVTDSEGKPADLRAMLGLDADAKLNAFEFCPAIASGFKEDCGKVTATMLFSTPYQENEKVLVLIGIVTVNADGTQSVAWQAFEGVGVAPVKGQTETYGGIKVDLTPEIVLAIENGTAIVSIVSK